MIGLERQTNGRPVRQPLVVVIIPVRTLGKFDGPMQLKSSIGVSEWIFHI